MTGGRKHVALKQYNRAEVGTNGLACPFAKSDAERYMNIVVCKPSEGFKEPRLLFEHVWRKHTRFYHCGFCSKHWSISTPRGEVSQKKEKHWKSCDGKLRGKLYYDATEQGSTEFLNWKQQELFEKIKSMRDVAAKLKALYEACDKPVPETYHVTAVPPVVQPQMTSRSSARATTHPDQQSVSHGEGIFEGFARLASGTQTLPQEGITATNVSKSSAALLAGDSSEVSGANRPRDADSGYASMPKNNGDTDDVSAADKRPVQSGRYLTRVPPDTGPYGLTGSLDVTASPGQVANDDGFDDSFTIDDYVIQDCFGRYDDTTSFLFGGISPSTRRDDSLLGLGMGLPNPGPETTGGPINPGDYVDIDPDLSEV